MSYDVRLNAEGEGIRTAKLSRTWKVTENEFVPGKSCKPKLKVLESPGLWFKLTEWPLSLPFIYTRAPCVNKCTKYLY